jgi:hypothetical protein
MPLYTPKWIQTGNNIYNANTGNVGIGTASPSTLFHLSSAATTATIGTISGTSITTGTALSIAGPTGTGITTTSGSGLVKIVAAVGDSGTAGSLLYMNPQFKASSATTGYGLVLIATDGTTSTNNDNGLYFEVRLSNNAAKTAYGINGIVSSDSTTADTLYGSSLGTTITGAISTGVRTAYGVYGAINASGANSGGTTNLYAGYFAPDSQGSTTGSDIRVYGVYAKNTAKLTTGGTISSYGVYISNATMDTTGTSTNIGLYVESPTGADTNYAAIFAGGNVGIGTTAPSTLLHLIKTTEQLRVGYDASNYYSTTVASNGVTTFSINGTSRATLASDGFRLVNSVGTTMFEFLEVSSNTYLDYIGSLNFRTNLGTQLGVVSSSFGWQFGAPTGGDKGASTANFAADIYKNGTAYTNPDYVLEHWATGKIQKYIDKEGAKDYQGLAPLSEVINFAQKNWHLPRFGQKAEHGLFSGSDNLLASLEEAYLYIFQLEERINKLEVNLCP